MNTTQKAKGRGKAQKFILAHLSQIEPGVPQSINDFAHYRVLPVAPKFTVTSWSRNDDGTAGCLFMASWTRREITEFGYLRDAMADDRCTSITIKRGGKTVVSVFRATAKHAVKNAAGKVFNWTSHGPGCVDGVPKHEDIFEPVSGFADGWGWADDATSREMAARRASMTSEERAWLTKAGVDVDALIARDRKLGFAP